MGLNICGTISKVILVLMNVAYIVLGLGFVIVGILFLVQQTEAELVTGNHSLAVGLVLIGAGVFICLVAILGIVAAVGELLSLLTVYLFAMLVLTVLQIAGTVLCMYNKDNIRRNAENKFKEYISKYKDATSDEYDAEINDIVDTLQHALHCCGLKTPYDWATENADYFLLYGFPDSCQCDVDYDDSTCVSIDFDITDDGIWNKGCNESFYHFVKENILYIGGAAIGVVVIEVIGFVISFGLCLCIISANSTERHVSRIQSMAYTPLESYPTNTVTNEYGPNDVDIDNKSMYIK